jgi:hypothetical protein
MILDVDTTRVSYARNFYIYMLATSTSGNEFRPTPPSAPMPWQTELAALAKVFHNFKANVVLGKSCLHA